MEGFATRLEISQSYKYEGFYTTLTDYKYKYSFECAMLHWHKFNSYPDVFLNSVSVI